MWNEATLLSPISCMNNLESLLDNFPLTGRNSTFSFSLQSYIQLFRAYAWHLKIYKLNCIEFH